MGRYDIDQSVYGNLTEQKRKELKDAGVLPERA